MYRWIAEGNNVFFAINTVRFHVVGDMWPEIVEHLKDSSLVAEIQKKFGVEIHYGKNLKHLCGESSSSETRDITFRKLPTTNSNNGSPIRGEPKENGYTRAEKGTVNAANIIPSNSEQKDISPIGEISNYTVTNYFWYYLFLFGTELGDEIFYSTFIPFWFWNVDGAVGRRVVLVWAIIMSTGQMLKDVIHWPRPACPPAVRLQTKWAEEYGMPSTHAMIGISIPFSVVLFTMNRYIYPLPIGCAIAFLWCTLVCTSRLYLGMHTVLDILAGLILAVALMIPLIPLVDTTDYYIITNFWGMTTLVAISIGVIVYYPCDKKWTPTRGDTSMVVSVTTGVHVGAWLNYTTGAMVAPVKSPPYPIIWLSYPMFGCMILRTILGFCSILVTRTVCKSFSYGVMSAILKVNSKDLMRSKDYSNDRNKVLVDLVHKYASCFMIGLNTVYLLPNFFNIIGIERSTFYTEM